jgi:hypothetical protein
MRLQKIHLLLELRGFGPIVISLAQGNVFAAGAGIQHLQTQILTLGIEIHRLVKGTDQVGILCFIFTHDLRRFVGGSVVVDEDLDGKLTFCMRKPSSVSRR